MSESVKHLYEKWGIGQGPDHPYGAHYKIKEGDICIEAGAFLARHGRIASKKVGPQGKVILIEPTPRHAAAIRDIVAILKLTNVTVLQKGVWREKGTMDFVDVAGVGSGNRLTEVGGHYEGKPNITVIKVNVDTIDNIIEDLELDHVDLLGADVEGAEVEMVKGMEKSLSEKRIRHVAIAAYHKHPDGNYEEVSTELRRHGYQDIIVDHGVVYAHA